MRAGTIVDATIIAAPPSTKNKDQARDPDMHQTKKGQQWHFGMKAHIAVDADSGLVHTVIGTAANVNDVTQANALLHGEETDAFGDAGYQGAHKRADAKAVRWHVAMRPGKRRALDKSSTTGRLLDEIERVKASLRAKVEHPFHVIKNLFGHRKPRSGVNASHSNRPDLNHFVATHFSPATTGAPPCRLLVAGSGLS
jgi:IS5 family transposase